MKRPHAPERENGQQVSLGEVSRLFPHLVEYLSTAAWEDGSPRELSTLLVFLDGHRWKVCLNDRATARVCFVSGADPEEALSNLEEGLAKDSVDWRPVAKKNRVPGRPST